MTVLHRFRHDPMMGTIVEVNVRTRRRRGMQRLATAVDAAIEAEMLRLDRIANADDGFSELRGWARGDVRDPSPELTALLTTAARWHERSGGAFNPAVGELTALWRAAERAGTPPSDDDLARAAASVAAPRIALDESGRPRPIGDATSVTLDAFATGWIMDRAVELAWGRWGIDTDGALSLVVNAGGDLVHRGEPALAVAVENPRRLDDGEPPLARVEVADAALATSGSAYKGFAVGGSWHSHVIDPRTGRPADAIAAVSVIAENAADADVLTTVLALGTPSEAITAADAWGVACMVVGADGEIASNASWQARLC